MGRRFEAGERATDTDVFRKQNVHFTKHLNSEIVKKMFRRAPRGSSKTLVIREKRWRGTSGSGFRVGFTRPSEADSGG